MLSGQHLNKHFYLAVFVYPISDHVTLSRYVNFTFIFIFLSAKKLCIHIHVNMIRFIRISLVTSHDLKNAQINTPRRKQVSNYYNQRQKCWEGYLFFSPLPSHPPSFKVAVNATTKLTLYFVWTSSTLDLGERGAIKSVARALN